MWVRPTGLRVGVVAITLIMAAARGTPASSTAGTTITPAAGTTTTTTSTTRLPPVLQAARLSASVARSTGPSSSQTAEAEQTFTLKLLDRLSGVATSNLVVSPSSLASALAMLEQGARGSTAGQIATVLANAGVRDL